MTFLYEPLIFHKILYVFCNGPTYFLKYNYMHKGEAQF